MFFKGLGWGIILSLVFWGVLVCTLSCDDEFIIDRPEHNRGCDNRRFAERHPCLCYNCDDEQNDDPIYPLDVCDDCEAATKNGCDDNGGECKRPECGTTRTESFTGKVHCAKDCADGTVHLVTCR